MFDRFMYIGKVTHDPSMEVFAEEILAIQYPINFVFEKNLLLLIALP